MTRLVTMREALEDPDLFGHPDVMGGASWAAWRVLLIAAMGEALTDGERPIFTQLTGRNVEPLEPVDELWCVIGRRGGKTRAAAVLAAYFGAMVDHTDKLAPGERGSIPLLAASTLQATKAFSYISGVFNHLPSLSDEVLPSTADTLRLNNAIDIEVRPANFRTIRSITSPCAIADEVAYWMLEGGGSTNPDTEILGALRPALATMGGPLVVISSPYARKGELYETWRRHFGPNGDPRILVAHAPSKVMNPLLSDAVIKRAYDRDHARASAEYGAQFRTDVEALLSREAIEAVMSLGVRERAPLFSITYRAFVDPSGGSADSMTLAIGHKEQTGLIVLDAVRERRPPFSPEDVVVEFAELLKNYRITKVQGDRYAGEWPRERFKVHGITYDVAEKPKSDLYRDLLPVINSRSCDLLDSDRLLSQLVGLERRTARGGRDSIDHGPGGHDDLCNAVAGCISINREGRSEGYWRGIMENV